jgi:DDB1- and CUL4-associated factor 7
VHSLDWCKTPAPGQAHRGRSAYRLAIASFLENYQNQIGIIGLQDERVLLEDEYSDYPDFTMLCEAHHGYPVTSLQWQPASAITSQWSNKSPAVELLATTGDALRIWEYSSEGSPTPSGYVGRSSQSASHSLHMKTALSGVSPAPYSPLSRDF